MLRNTLSAVVFIILLVFLSAASADEFPYIYQEDPAAVSPSTADAYFEALRTQGSNIGTVSISAQMIPSAEISELTRALRDDVDLIYQYVYNEIEVTPVFGLRKSPLGTYLDKKGTPFDVANLMLALVREAGYTANLKHGVLSLPAARANQFLGTTGDGLNALRVLQQGYIPIQNPVPSDPNNPGTVLVEFSSTWIEVDINGVLYQFDPALKIHTMTPGYGNLKSILGYSATGTCGVDKLLPSCGLLDAAGGTLTGNYWSSFDDTTIEAKLNKYAENLIDFIRTQNPTAELKNVIGAWEIEAISSAPVRQLQHPYLASNTTPVSWTAVPNPYRATLRIANSTSHSSSSPICWSAGDLFYADEIDGLRLSVMSNSVSSATLRLEGATVAVWTGLQGKLSLDLCVNNPFPDPGSTSSDPNLPPDITLPGVGDTSSTRRLDIQAGSGFSIMNSWGAAGAERLEYHQSRLAEYEFNGGAPTSEEVLGEALTAMGANWLVQRAKSSAMVGSITNRVNIPLNDIGISGQATGPYVDIVGTENSASRDGNTDTNRLALLYSNAGVLSALEAATISQITGLQGVSTVSLIDLANSQGLGFFVFEDASEVDSAPLVGYSAAEIASLKSTLSEPQTVNRAIVPESGDLTIDQWVGATFLNQKFFPQTGVLGLSYSINGAKGGFTPVTFPTTQTVTGVKDNAQSEGWVKRNLRRLGEALGDPVNSFTGSYYYDHNDITVGNRPFPYGFSLQRSYDSGSRLSDRSLGLGWTHNFDLSAIEYSDGLQGFGAVSPIDAAAMIVTFVVATDLIDSETSPKNIIVSTLAQDWGVGHLVDNVVTVTIPGNNFSFTKLPEGLGYNTPPKSSSRLSKDGTFLLETLPGDQLVFNSLGKADTWTNANGFIVDFEYNTANQVSRVSNGFGWELNFGYNASDLLSSVDDGNGRSVSYAYDANGNQTSFSDAEGEITIYAYAVGRPGLMSEVYYPSFPTTASVSNTYNSLGLVQSQTNSTTGSAASYEYFFAGSRTEMIDPLGNSNILIQDNNGNITQSIDQLGRVTETVFDGRQRVSEIRFPEGNLRTLTYDDSSCVEVCTNNVSSVTRIPDVNRGGAPITEAFSYWGANKKHKLHTLTDPRLNLWSFDYDTKGNLLTATEPAVSNGVPTTQYEYYDTGDGRDGMVRAVVDPTGVRTEYQLSPITGSTSSVSVDPSGLDLVTSYTYDVWGNQHTVRDPENRLTRSFFDCERRARATVPPNPGAGGQNLPSILVDYDQDGRTIALKKVSGSVSSLECNSGGINAATILQTWSSEYFASGRLSKEIDPEAAETSYTYDLLDRLENVQDPDGRETETEYDAAGQVVLSRAVQGNSEEVIATFEYDLNGLQAAILDARGNRTRYVYDGHDRLISQLFPEADAQGASSPNDSEAMQYDASGNVTSVVVRSGEVISYAFDALNRQTGKTGAVDQDVTYEYDLAGRLLSTRFSNGQPHVIVYSYDDAGRLSAVNDNSRLISYLYDKSSLRTEMTWPDGFKQSYRYDGAGRIASIKQGPASDSNAPTIVSYSFDSLGRIDAQDFRSGTGLSTSITYFPDNKMDTLSYDLIGTSEDLGYNLTYTAANLLASKTTSLASFVYDAPYSEDKSYSSNGLNQYVSSNSEHGFRFQFRYDLNGNLIGDGGRWSYEYDVEDRLLSAYQGNEEVRFGYDPVGRRASKSTLGLAGVRYIYDGDEIIAETDENGLVLRRFLFSIGLDDPIAMYLGSGTTSPNYYMLDPKGSVVGLVDATGSVVERYKYSEFGIPQDRELGSSSNPLRFASRPWDAKIGLYNSRSRSYSPRLGRFLQADSIGYADGLNMYAYVGNDPVNFVDPSGLGAEVAGERLGSAIWHIGGITGGYALSRAVDQFEEGDTASAVISLGESIATAALTGATLGTGSVATQATRIATTRVTATAAIQTIQLSKAKFGHTFTKHGENATEFVLKRAKGSGKPSGQFLDDQAAARLILDNLKKTKNGAISIPIPKGFPARIVNPDGTYGVAKTIRLVPGGKGVKSAFPEP